MEQVLYIVIPILLSLAIFIWFVIDTQGGDFFEFGCFENWILRKLGLQAKPSSYTPSNTGDTDVVGKKGKVIKEFVKDEEMYSGKVEIAGAIYSAEAVTALEAGDSIVVLAREGLTLKVERD